MLYRHQHRISLQQYMALLKAALCEGRKRGLTGDIIFSSLGPFDLKVATIKICILSISERIVMFRLLETHGTQAVHFIVGGVFQRLGGAGIRRFRPGEVTKQPLPGTGLHYPLNGWQACPELNSFQNGVRQISPREGLFSYRPPSKRGQICDIPAPPQSLNDSVDKSRWTHVPCRRPPHTDGAAYVIV